jgi:N-methylhydantoinase A
MSGGHPVALGIDIGGTFTDVVLAGPRGIQAVAKVLTTPDDPARAAVQGARAALDQAGVDGSKVSRVVHATTLATNTILERSGRPAALVTTKGFRHLLALGRHARIEAERYDPAFRRIAAPVPLPLVFEVEERLDARGEVVTPLRSQSVEEIADAIAGLDVVGIAVCLMHSYANPEHEQTVASLLKQRLDLPVTISWDVSPEVREYDRTTTTVMSAIVRPVMEAYLAELGIRLRDIGITAPLAVMESSGGVTTVDRACARAIVTVESGPAAGVIASQAAAAVRGISDVICFDMGGTTAKAAVVRGGSPDITHDFQVGGHGSFGTRRSGTGVPVRVPTIDLAEVGAGGGSMAWIDDRGTLHVGPRSAGALPGPACYGLGGTAPTVTDANVVLGYLDLGRTAPQLDRFDQSLASAALEPLANEFGVDTTEMAAAVYELATAAMAGAIHVVTVQRGIDPRRFVLVVSGGAGPLHAARIADRFDIATVLVPSACGVASAVGLLAADYHADTVRTIQGAGETVRPAELEAGFGEMELQVAAQLAAPHEAIEFQRSADVRYRRQAHAISVAINGAASGADLVTALASDFFALHRQRFGVGEPGPIDIVNLRVQGTRAVERATFDRAAQGVGTSAPRITLAWSPADSCFRETAVWPRERLVAGQRFNGPALVEDGEATVLVPSEWSAQVEIDGSLLLRANPGRRTEVPNR